MNNNNALSSDGELVDRLLWLELNMGEGWNAEDALDRQVAFGEMTPAHAARLLQMVRTAR